METTLGKVDVITLTYLGAAARKLMRQDIYINPNPEFTGEFDLMRNARTPAIRPCKPSFAIA